MWTFKATDKSTCLKTIGWLIPQWDSILQNVHVIEVTPKNVFFKIILKNMNYALVEI